MPKSINSPDPACNFYMYITARSSWPEMSAHNTHPRAVGKTVPKHVHPLTLPPVLPVKQGPSISPPPPVDARSSLHCSERRGVERHPSSRSYYKPPENRSFKNCDGHKASSISARRKEFVYRITKPGSKPGFVVCRLCHANLWGPNGKISIRSNPQIPQSNSRPRHCLN